MRCALGACAAAALLVCLGPWYAPYSAARPQRLMVFHARRTVHAPPAPPAERSFFWLPDLDPNSPRSVARHGKARNRPPAAAARGATALYPAVPELAAARITEPEECSRWVYCGAPYYLPVLSLVSTGHSLPAELPPLATAAVDVAVAPFNATARLLSVNVTGARVAAAAGRARRGSPASLAGPSHVVVVLAPAEGGRVAWSSAVAAPTPAGRWNGRLVYFFALHQAREPRPWRLQFLLAHTHAPPAQAAQLAVAGHAMAGALKLHATHERLLARLPPWVAATGWGVDLHLFAV